MKEFVSQILRTRTVKDSAITFGGVFTNGFLGLIFYLLVARFLGPTTFGIFSVAVISLTLIGDIADLGMTTGLVRFVGKYINKNPKLAYKFLKLTLEVKFLVWFIVLIIGWLATPLIAGQVFGKGELIIPLRYSLVGVGGALLFSFATFSVQAIQKFLAWSILNISINLLRLLTVALLIYLGLLTLDSTLAVYVFFPFLGFLVGLFILPNFFKVKNEVEVAKRLFSYNIWVAAFTLIAAISSRLDTFLSTRLLSLEEVGIYSVAVNLASIVPQVVFALGTVAAPKLASFNSDKKAVSYLKKLQLFVFGLCGSGLAIGIPLSYFLIPALYGQVYTASIPPLIILLVAQAIFLFSVPVHTGVTYYFGYPKLFVWVSLVHLAIVLGLGWVLISNFGIIGAAWTVLLGSVSNFLIPAIWILRKFRKI